MDLERITLSEISEAVNDKYYSVSLICGNQTKKQNKQKRNGFVNTNNRLVAATGGGGQRDGWNRPRFKEAQNLKLYISHKDGSTA